MTMIFTSQIVIGHAMKAGKDHIQALHYGGVGAGIAISSLVVYLIGVVFDGGGASWREEWIAGAVFSFATFLLVWRVMPAGPPRHASALSEPPLKRTKPLFLTTLAYGLFGFGYVITATFIVAIARMAAAGAFVEFLAWFVTGCAAAISLFLWKPVLKSQGLKRAFVIVLAVEAIGVFASVMLPPVPGVLAAWSASGADLHGHHRLWPSARPGIRRPKPTPRLCADDGSLRYWTDRRTTRHAAGLPR